MSDEPLDGEKLFYAGCFGSLDQLAAHDRAGGSLNLGWDCNGRTAAHGAASADRVDILRFLDGKGADMNIRSKDWRTPLMWAAHSASLGAAHMLVRVAGVDTTLKDDKGKTAAQIARQYRFAEVAEFLEQHPIAIAQQTVREAVAEGSALPIGTRIRVEPHLGVGTYELCSKNRVRANDYFVRFATVTLKLQLGKPRVDVPGLGACAWSIVDVSATPPPARDAAVVTSAAVEGEAAMKAAAKALAEEQAAQDALAEARRAVGKAQEQANARERKDLVGKMKNADVVHVVSTPWGGSKRVKVPDANQRGGELARQLKKKLS